MVDAKSAYDLVYARLLLTQLNDPEATLRRMMGPKLPDAGADSRTSASS